MKLYVKNMVSQRCKLLVKQELRKLNIAFLRVDLGVMELLQDISEEQSKQLNSKLKLAGLELLSDKRSILVEAIRNLITQMIQYEEEEAKVNYSETISEKLGYDYTYLANVFSEVKGMTIQQFIILNKIEKVKELMLYDELTLTEIAFQMHYSSVAHLSNQFKKTTGLTPSFYKGISEKKRGNLEDL